MKIKLLSLLTLLAALQIHATEVAPQAAIPAITFTAYLHTPLFTLKGHTQSENSSENPSVNSIVFSPDGTKVVTASDDKTAKIWDVATGELLHTLKGHTGYVWSAAFSPNGNYIVTASADGTVKIWDVANGTLIRTLEGHTDWVISAAFSPDSSKLVTASNDRTARIWDASTGQILHILKGLVLSAAFSPDGTKVVTTSLDGSTGVWDARVWDAQTGTSIFSLAGASWANDAAFSPDGTKIVTAVGDNAKIWEVETGALIRTLVGHTQGVSFAAFSPDGRYVVTASWDNTARIWDVETGQLQHTLKGHTYKLIFATFSADGNYVVTASWDNTVRLWDASNGQEVLRISTRSYGNEEIIWKPIDKNHVISKPGNDLSSAAFSPDGTKVATGCYNGTIKIWDITQALFQYEKFITIKSITDLKEKFENIKDKIYKKLRVLNTMFADPLLTESEKKNIHTFAQRLNGLNILGTQKSREGGIRGAIDTRLIALNNLPMELEKANNARQFADFKKKMLDINSDLQKIETRMREIFQDSQVVEQRYQDALKQRRFKGTAYLGMRKPKSAQAQAAQEEPEID